jgi:hypothetical protein
MESSLRCLVFSVECLMNDRINRPTDDDLNHWRIVFNDRWWSLGFVVVVDDEDANIKLGTEFDRSMDGIVLCFFVRRWRNFRFEWTDRLIVVDDCDLGSTDKGTSDRNGYGSVFDVLTIGSLRTYLLGTTITKSSFSMDKSGSKF